MTITQLGISKVKIEHNNEQKMCKFFVVSENEHVLLGMPDTNMLNIINIKCTTIDPHETDRANNCSTNTALCQDSRYKQHYTNMVQEADRAEKCNENTDSISKILQ